MARMRHARFKKCRSLGLNVCGHPKAMKREATNQERDKKILIKDGWFKKSRNINYLGEMMIYLSYAILGDSHIPFFILAYIWLLLFIPNMLYKDSKMLKKPGGHKYYMTSNLLYPF